MKNVLFTADFGIIPNAEQDVSKALQSAFDAMPDDAVFQFKKGRYFIKNKVYIKNKKNIRICGNFSTLIAHFDPCGPISENNDVFVFADCDDCEISGFFFDTDAPIGATGTVTAINYSNKTADVLIDDEFPVTGFEHFCATNSFDENGSPDYALATYNNIPVEQEFTTTDGTIAKRLVGLNYTVISKQTVRLDLGTSLTDSLKIGHRINFRYEIYGNCIFNFASCNRFLIKDITIYSAASFGVCVNPRSSDFIFDNFCIRVPDNSNRLMASNADGIHLLGLFGKLTLRNCNMEHMGDDTLNIHGLAGGIKHIEADGKHMVINRPFRGQDLKLPEYWAVKGDKINVYDSETFLLKGSFTVNSIDFDGNVTYDIINGTIATGDTLANTKYFASLHIDGCVVRNTRARGFLVQTHNVLIENSYIYGMSLPAMLFSPDIKVWWEVGPTENVEIRNNIVEYCANIKSKANKGAIVFKACHDAGGEDYPAGVHKNIHIHGNRFIDIPHSAIYVSAAKDVRIEENRFENCCCDVKDTSTPYAFHDIVCINCENLTVKDNISTQSEEHILYKN